MALPSSGTISMSQINAEFGRGTNLNAYRGTTYYTSSAGPFTFPSGAIAFSNFYGTQLASPGVTVSISGIPSINGTYTYPSIGGCSISFLSDGTYTTNANVSGNPSGNWATPTTAGAGNSYWIRFTQTASAGRPGAVSGLPTTWTSMASTITVLFQQTPPGIGGGSRTFTIEISSSSGGSPVVATKTGFVMTAVTN